MENYSCLTRRFIARVGTVPGNDPRLVAINCSLFLPRIMLQVASTSYAYSIFVASYTCCTDGSN